MLISVLGTKKAVVDTLLNMEKPPVEFSHQDWVLMEKVVRVLKPFKEATLMLSKEDASISSAIHVTTLIIKSLAIENPTEDRGVLTMKRALKKNMETRFSNLESKFHYTASTLLDSKCKHYFFRDPDTFERTKEYIVQEIVSDLSNAQTEPNPQVRYNALNIPGGYAGLNSGDGTAYIIFPFLDFHSELSPGILFSIYIDTIL